jgi:hypothetical protein
VGDLSLRETGPVRSSLPAEHSSIYQANGAPAPPCDVREDIGDLLDLFTF